MSRNMAGNGNFKTEIWTLFLLVAVSMIFSNVYAYEVDLKGKITSVLDGDTVKIGDRKIRLMIVDTPELGTRSTADDAKVFTKQHCYNKNATVDVNDLRKKDASGRTLGVVICGEDTQPVNQLLLELDYGVLYRQYNCDPKYNEFYNQSWVKC